MYTDRLIEQLNRICANAYAVPGLMTEAGRVLVQPAEDGQPVSISRDSLNAVTVFGSELQDSDEAMITGQVIAVPVAGPDGSVYYLFARRESENTEENAEISRADALIADHLKLLAGALADCGRDEKTAGELLEAMITGEEGAITDAREAGLPEACLEAAAYRVICVKLGKHEDFREEAMEDILVVLKSVFPAEQGFVCFPVKRDNAAGVLLPFGQADPGETLSAGEQFASQAADTVSAEAMQNVAVGLSAEFKSTEGLTAAYIQALSAVKAGTVFEVQSRCYTYEKLSLERLICSVPRETCLEYVRETLGDKLLADRSAAELLSTVKTFLDNNQNGSEAARSMYIHRNTMIYRLEKFQKLTGQDCSDFAAGMRVRIALLVLKYLEA